MTERSDLASMVKSLASARVLAVGDLMLDRFVYGSVERISPEAPVPILRIDREQMMLGGVGNVARNLRALGATVCLVAATGRDQASREVKDLLRDDMDVESHLIDTGDRPTTIKTRYIAGGQQMMRADKELAAPLDEALAEDIAARAEADLSQSKALVLSDYGKGVLTDKVLTALIAAANAQGVTVIVDPKGNDYSRYAGADLVTPNRRELFEATGLPVDSDEEVIAAAQSLMAKCSIGGVLVTRSQDGMTLVRNDGSEPLHLGATAREVFDVSGAGDTVVATLAAALASGIEIEKACALANAAAGVVVAKIGTATTSASELATAVRAKDRKAGGAKSATLDEALEMIATWRRDGLKIGFTNGCFDLLHPGHVSLMRQARATCDRLVVGLNSDASVRRLKGETRPVQPDSARSLVLASLEDVDLVVIFAEDTPYDLISAIRPDTLVKGADYTVETVAGADIVQSYGGQVVLADLVDGQSTTKLLEKQDG